MKLNFSTSELPHIWASQAQSEGKAGNLYFLDRVIYSYGPHFPIAKIMMDGETVLFTTMTYSNTTARHLSQTRAAISHKTVIHCKNVLANNTREHANNLLNLEQSIVDTIEKHSRARIFDHTNNIIKQVENYNNYASFFAISDCLPVDLEELFKRYDSVLIKRTEYRKQESAEKKEREKAKRIELQEALDKWTNGESVYNDLHTLPCRLRISGDAIQTSWGASVPIADYRLSYAVLKSNPQRLLNCKCGYYTVNAVNDESVTIGCHNISMMEIDRIGQLLQ